MSPEQEPRHDVAAELDARLQATGQRLDGAAQSKGSFLVGKVRRHLYWARTEGVRKLIEEDELNPVARVRTAVSKATWRRANPQAAGTGRAVFLVGVQRSGTNMVARGLDAAPEFQVYNENNGKAFFRYRLLDDTVVDALVRGSGHRYVLFKPLCDSHRVVDLLARHGRPGAPAVALWAFRDFRGRAASAEAKFGDSDLLAMRAINAGLAANMWQAQGLSDTALAQLAEIDIEALDAYNGAALFWWARNTLYFDLGLDTRDDVALISYRLFLDDPDLQLRSICRVLDLDAREDLVIRNDNRSAKGPKVARTLDPQVLALCEDLLARLDATALAQAEAAKAALGSVKDGGRA